MQRFLLIVLLCLLTGGLESTGLSLQRGKQEPIPETPLEIFALIRDRKDRTPRRFIEALGQMKTEAALGVLKRSVDQMRGRWAKQYVFAAMRHFMDDAVLREEALKVARGVALKKASEDAIAAAAAMCNWGPHAHEILAEVAADGWDEDARSYAISRVRDALKSQGDAEALTTVLEAYKVPASGTSADGVALLRSFHAEEHFGQMAKFAGSSKSPLPRLLLLLDAMGGHGDGIDVTIDKGATHVLEAALKHRDYTVQYRALSAAARRGGLSDLRAVERLAKSKDPAVQRAALLAILRSQAQGDDAGARGLDPSKLATSDSGVERQAAAIGLGERGGDEALAILHELVADEDWAVAAEAIRSLVRLRDRSSIPVLIEGLDGASGRLRGDFRSALVQITGLELGKGAGSWKTFWAKENATFQVPTAEAVAIALKKRAKKRKEGDSEVEFYGIEILSDAFVLVVDTSGSMNARVEGPKTRLDVAKDQMTKTIQRVNDGVLFNVVPFSNAARPLTDGLEPMEPEAREEALEYVDSLFEAGGTNIYDSLSAAFEDERVDTIYLLSDGIPSNGEITDPLSLRAEVDRWNSTRGIMIHSIAIGQDHPLLKGLAKDSGGEYVKVD